jgi:hypothetical protein
MKFYTTSKTHIKLIEKFLKMSHTTNIDGADLVVFPDEFRDLSPEFYGRSNYNGENTKIKDDARLMRIYMLATYELGLPIIAFGSGALLVSMCVGADMWSNAEHHKTTHMVRTKGGIFSCSDNHTQIMNPFVMDDDEYSVLSYNIPHTAVNLSYETKTPLKIKTFEVEAVYYKYNNALCIQNPVYMNRESLYAKHIKEIIDVFNTDDTKLKRYETLRSW